MWGATRSVAIGAVVAVGRADREWTKRTPRRATEATLPMRVWVHTGRRSPKWASHWDGRLFTALCECESATSDESAQCDKENASGDGCESDGPALCESCGQRQAKSASHSGDGLHAN
ncbi:unnamed protein product [Bursaphelenchus okinawaensis]|uniref:Uncharacterized protein n=1 Tax=Bursaphelenchus okinawaensis TaxID=465554 RepID=A0A811JS98_9BILA|nr:unnamed protein product [Bursaphelenchus okinawaensis]CAG9080185.1 unnamed protein product [Bursaphelenchus okinawaensis]